MNPSDKSLETVQLGLDDLQGIRDRLRGNIRALSSGQFSSPAPSLSHPQLQAVRQRMAADEAVRSEGVASTIDAAFHSLRQQVVGDIVGTLDTIARLEQFNAQAAASTAQGVRRTPPPAVIDVEARESATPLHTEP